MAASSPILPAETGLVLVGYRATGKTTVGRLLADRLKRPFLDADIELERRVGRSIPDIFAREGEAAFRDLEEHVIRALCEEVPGAVLATGGGAVLRGANRRRLGEFGVVIWLRCPADEITSRLRLDSGGRPALTDAGLLEEVSAVLAEREPHYGEVSHMVVDATQSPAERVADAVLQGLASRSIESGGRR